LENEALLWDEERGLLYHLGGELSADGSINDSAPNSFFSNSSRPPAIWVVPIKNEPGSWSMALGDGGPREFPPDILQPAGGAYTVDRTGASYIGVSISFWSTSVVTDKRTYLNIPGVIHFDFATKTLTNSTEDGGYFASRNTGPNGTHFKPGFWSNAPFGPDGITISLGGRTYPYQVDDTSGSGYAGIFIWDKTRNTSYYQPTTGDIPPSYSGSYTLGDPDTVSCFAGTDEQLKTYDM
jgi:hypothetical protein